VDELGHVSGSDGTIILMSAPMGNNMDCGNVAYKQYEHFLGDHQCGIVRYIIRLSRLIIPIICA